MTDSAKTVAVNPLASSSAHVAGTRALGVIIEPEQVMAVSEAAGGAVAASGGESAPGPVGAAAEAKAEPHMAQADPIRQADPMADIERHASDMAEGLRVAVQDGVAHSEAAYEGTLHVFEEASHRMKAALDEAGTGATVLAFKLVEFVQANADSTLDLARDYAAVRTLPDAINVHAAYLRRQFDLLAAQAEEFRRIGAELTSKAAAPFETQGKRTAEAPRAS